MLKSEDLLDHYYFVIYVPVQHLCVDRVLLALAHVFRVDLKQMPKEGPPRSKELQSYVLVVATDHVLEAELRVELGL